MSSIVKGAWLVLTSVTVRERDNPMGTSPKSRTGGSNAPLTRRRVTLSVSPQEITRSTPRPKALRMRESTCKLSTTIPYHEIPRRAGGWAHQSRDAHMTARCRPQDNLQIVSCGSVNLDL